MESSLDVSERGRNSWYCKSVLVKMKQNRLKIDVKINRKETCDPDIKTVALKQNTNIYVQQGEKQSESGWCGSLPTGSLIQKL